MLMIAWWEIRVVWISMSYEYVRGHRYNVDIHNSFHHRGSLLMVQTVYSKITLPSNEVHPPLLRWSPTALEAQVATQHWFWTGSKNATQKWNCKGDRSRENRVLKWEACQDSPVLEKFPSQELSCHSRSILSFMSSLDDESHGIPFWSIIYILYQSRCCFKSWKGCLITDQIPGGATCFGH